MLLLTCSGITAPHRASAGSRLVRRKDCLFVTTIIGVVMERRDAVDKEIDLPPDEGILDSTHGKLTEKTKQ